MTDSTPNSSSDSPLADAAIAEYLRRVDRGELIRQDEFLEEHPEAQEALRAFFDASQLFESWAGPTLADTSQSITPLSRLESPFQNEEPVFAGSEDEDEVVLLEAVSHPGSTPVRTVGRYQIERLLGRGAMGEVYLAYDPQLDRFVALKLPFLQGDRYQDDKQDVIVARFYREARAAAGLQHPNICPIFDVGCDGEQHYIAMSYVPGRTLAETLQDGQQYTPPQATAIAAKLADALHHAHQYGVVHRDLKPSNVIIDERGEPIVTDFGLARRLYADDVRVTQSGAIIGSPAYLAPEQVSGTSEHEETLTDIYALGVIYYELLTGRVPFGGSVASVLVKIVSESPRPPVEFVADMDSEVNAVCMKLLAKAPGDRHANMAEVRQALELTLQPPVSMNTSAGFGEPAAVPEKKGISERSLEEGDRLLRNALIASGAGLLAVGIVLLALGIYFWRDASGTRLPSQLAQDEEPNAVSPSATADVPPTLPPAGKSDASTPPPPADASTKVADPTGGGTKPAEPPAIQALTELPSFRYGFEEDGLYPFEVEIIAQLPDADLVMQGTPALLVRDADELGTTLALRGGLIAREESRDNNPFRHMSFMPFRSHSGYAGLLGSGPPGEHLVTIDSEGDVDTLRGDSQLPLLLGQLSLLILDSFPSTSAAKWSDNSELAVEATPRDITGMPRYPDFSMMHMRLPPHMRPAREVTPGERRVNYEWKSFDRQSGRAVLHKEIVVEANGIRNTYRLDVEGDVLLDVRSGLPIKATLRGHSQTPQYSHPVPMTIVYSQMDRKLYEQRMADAAERAEQARMERERAEAEARKPLTPADWPALKEKLTGEAASVREVAKRLQSAESIDPKLIPESRQVIRSILDGYREGSDRLTTRELTTALCRVATDEDVPYLLQLLEHEDIPLRKLIIVELGEQRDERAAEPLAQRLTNAFDRDAAAKALKQLREAGREAVLPLKEHDDQLVRAAVLDILSERP